MPTCCNCETETAVTYDGSCLACALEGICHGYSSFHVHVHEGIIFGLTENGDAFAYTPDTIEEDPEPSEEWTPLNPRRCERCNVALTAVETFVCSRCAME